MSEKKRISLPIIVEGRYDKATLSGIYDCTVITLDGFSVFNSKEKRALISKIAVNGVILLTDSDGAGKQLRSFVMGFLPKEKIYNAYVPKIEGKEKRKTKASKEGLLGVEGMSPEVLERSLAPFIEAGGRCVLNDRNSTKMITKVDFFEAGLSGGECSSSRRATLAEHFGLPSDMTAKALLSALNIITDLSGYERAVSELFG